MRRAFFKKNLKSRKKKIRKKLQKKKKSQKHQKCHLKYVSASFSMFLAILGSFSPQKLPKIEFADLALADLGQFCLTVIFSEIDP